MFKLLSVRASRILWLSIALVVVFIWGSIIYKQSTSTDPCPVHGPVRAERSPATADAPSSCNVFCRMDGATKAHLVIWGMVVAFCIAGCVFGWQWMKKDRSDR